MVQFRIPVAQNSSTGKFNVTALIVPEQCLHFDIKTSRNILQNINYFINCYYNSVWGLI